MKSRVVIGAVIVLAVLCFACAVFGAPTWRSIARGHGSLAMWIQIIGSGLAFGAVKVKDVSASAAKFVARAQAAGPAYQAGVTAAGPQWQANAVAAEPTWSAAVADAANRKAFSKGINAAGAAKYETNAAGKGAQRYPSGVAGAQNTWQTNVAPYLQTIASLTLPPRQPKGNPANYARVSAVADALRAKKVAGH